MSEYERGREDAFLQAALLLERVPNLNRTEAGRDAVSILRTQSEVLREQRMRRELVFTSPHGRPLILGVLEPQHVSQSTPAP